MEDRFGPKGNNPPEEQELFQAAMNDKTAALRDRYYELIAAASRIPEQCKDEETAGKLGDMIKLITACHKNFEATRVNEKEPHLKLSRAVDGFFKKFTESLEQTKKKVARPLEAYLFQKEQERRAAAAEAARLQRVEAERLAQEAAELAQASMLKASEDALKEAVRIDEEANKSEKQSEAKPAELARTRGDYGSLSTLRTVWVGEIVEKDKVDLNTLRPFMSDDVLQKLINAAVKAGFREIAGVHIYQQSTASVR